MANVRYNVLRTMMQIIILIGLVFYGIYLWVDSEDAPLWQTIVVLTAPGAALGIGIDFNIKEIFH